MVFLTFVLLIANEPVLPMPLVKMLDSHKALKAGFIAYQVQQPDASGRLKSRNYVAEFAENGDMALRDNGDDEGWIDRNSDDSPISKFPRILLRNRDGDFEYRDTTITADQWGPGLGNGRTSEPGGILYSKEHQDVIPKHWKGTFHDIRSLGSISYDAMADAGLSVLDQLKSPNATWSTSVDGPIHIVTCNWANSSMTMTWEIDSSAGWNARRVAVSGPIPELCSEMTASLGQVNGSWLPLVTEYSVAGRLQKSVTIADADFSHTEKYQALPTSKYLEPGTQVADKTEANTGIRAWDGEHIVSLEDWNAAVAAGQKKHGKNWERVQQGLPSPYMTPENELSRRLAQLKSVERRRYSDSFLLWRRFVRNFCERYSLDADQRQKAELIRRECQERAELILERTRAQFLELNEKIVAPGTSPDHVSKLRQSLDRLNEPIDRIFTDELKPRLEKIPTATQRTNATPSKPTSAPTDSLIRD